MNTAKISQLEAILGYHFHNPTLLQQAVTHISYANEVLGDASQGNERLEFLGDAVLELVSSREQKTPLTAADMAAIKGALTEAGLLAFVVENRIHVVPPCTITAEQVAQGLAIFDAVFARFASLAK